MRLVDSDDGDALSRLVGAVCAEFHGARIGGPVDDGGMACARCGRGCARRCSYVLAFCA